MTNKALLYLNTTDELEDFLSSIDEVKLYGAGYYLGIFLEGTSNLNKDFLNKIACILVTSSEGNPSCINDIPIAVLRKDAITPNDHILLTLGHRYTQEIYDHLRDTCATIVELNFNMFQEKPYHDVRQSLLPFIEGFPNHLLRLNEPVSGQKQYAWTCWWQGEEHAPDIIKVCLQSQKKNLPSGIEHIVITEDNYSNYIRLPEYILQKVESGNISLTHLSDIIRVNLLYKYGGLWMDAAAFLLEPLPLDIFNYPIYTRNLPETQFCSNAMWTIGFLYAKAGNKLFRFLSEALFYYFSVHNELQYYLTLDYMIAIACNIFPEIEKQFRQIPYNNEGTFKLRDHLMDPFDAEQYADYIKGTFVQMLTHKLNPDDIREKNNTIYKHIVNIDKNRYVL